MRRSIIIAGSLIIVIATLVEGRTIGKNYSDLFNLNIDEDKTIQWEVPGNCACHT